MSNQKLSATEAAARLARALSAQADISHEQAEALIPSLIDAEGAGESVEASPVFAGLLRHLDHCERCLTLYEQLAEDAHAVLGEAETLPSVAPIPPEFFPAPVRLADHVLLQVAHGLIRRFTLTFDLPRLAPSLATLSGSQRALYSDKLDPVQGTPLLAITVGRDVAGVWLQVAVREPGPKTTWRLQLEVSGRTLTAITDARGIARFTLPSEASLGEVRVHCEELPVDFQDR